ncbi:MAG: hypothetical protein EON54_14815 [Alcaligenaceae bacterium]|nr:MAG: hypothetical protein EON54_14815 [Alcaligenaceae bacterium]
MHRIFARNLQLLRRATLSNYCPTKFELNQTGAPQSAEGFARPNRCCHALVNSPFSSKSILHGVELIWSVSRPNYMDRVTWTWERQPMSTRETPADRIAMSIICLRNARAGLAQMAKLNGNITYRTQIDICDELISAVQEIDSNLRQLSSQMRRERAGEINYEDGSPQQSIHDNGGIQKASPPTRAVA